jgi:hypothetical protein
MSCAVCIKTGIAQAVQCHDYCRHMRRIIVLSLDTPKRPARLGANGTSVIFPGVRSNTHLNLVRRKKKGALHNLFNPTNFTKNNE